MLDARASRTNLSGYLLVLLAYRISRTGYVAATREVSIVLSAMVGVILFREGAPRRRVFGACVIVAGAIVVALSR